jgi:hypothetical protein
MRRLVCFTLLLLACAHKSKITGNNEIVTHEDDLRKMAAFELGCNEQRLDVMDMGNDSAAVSGCDKKAVYKYDGGWTLSSKDDKGAATK